MTQLPMLKGCSPLGSDPKLDELMVLVAVAAAAESGIGYDLDILKREAKRAAGLWFEHASRDPEAAKLEEMRAEIAELRKRCEVVNIRVDGKPFKVMRETMGFRIYSLVRSSNDYHLAREILGGSQAEDIPDLFDPLIVNEGDSFVTFPGARFG